MGELKLRKIIDEFKEFALKGNVMDLAVGIIIGGAFQKIVASLVSDIVMPILGLIVGKNIFNSLNFKIKPYGSDVEVLLNLGSFLQVTFDFLLVALSVFFLIKGLNSLRRLSDVKINLNILKNVKKQKEIIEKSDNNAGNNNGK